MKRGNVHLTYCSNIHPGERWPDVAGALADALPRIREHLAFDGPFGVGLRLSAGAARSLEAPDALSAFRRFLHDGDYYVPTINGFPYGAFHGTRVKENVYLPDWRSPERVAYTNQLARILATLAADRGDTEGSISTVPGAFRAEVRSTDDVRAIVAGMLDHAAYLARLHADTGVAIALALEPEPACFLETSSDALAFFRDHLFDAGAIAAAARRNGVSLTADIVARHVGVCLDACHMAVEFEDPEQAIADVVDAGVRICKVQLSAALRLTRRQGAASPRQLLEPFAEDTYLHQVVVSHRDGLTKYTDLPDALRASDAAEPHQDDEWRVHFHVPIFMSRMEGFDTTQAYLSSVIAFIKRTSMRTCLEVETYTWSVLPEEYRTSDACTAIARELAWVQSELDR